MWLCGNVSWVLGIKSPLSDIHTSYMLPFFCQRGLHFASHMEGAGKPGITRRGWWFPSGSPREMKRRKRHGGFCYVFTIVCWCYGVEHRMPRSPGHRWNASDGPSSPPWFRHAFGSDSWACMFPGSRSEGEAGRGTLFCYLSWDLIFRPSGWKANTLICLFNKHPQAMMTFW